MTKCQLKKKRLFLSSSGNLSERNESVENKAFVFELRSTRNKAYKVLNLAMNHMLIMCIDLFQALEESGSIYLWYL